MYIFISVLIVWLIGAVFVYRWAKSDMDIYTNKDKVDNITLSVFFWWFAILFLLFLWADRINKNYLKLDPAKRYQEWLKKPSKW